MAATETVHDRLHGRNISPATPEAIPRTNPAGRVPRHGVLTLHGYGISIRVESGHLTVEDGIGADRRKIRLPRVQHGLRRLIVIGADGMVSLAALRWLADQHAAFVMLERNGRVLATTGPVRPSDAKLRRAQAMAAPTGADLTIARELISRKLAGQESVAREQLRDEAAAQAIADFRLSLAETENLDDIRLLEAQGAAAYWAAWRNVPVSFPRKDLPRVPQHWQTFGTRKSLLTGSQRLATNPPNAMLNYLYAILESESRLAAAALGLDPGLGFIHLDTPARDSLACDLMEAVRPQIDAFVLDYIQRPLKREWFFEQRDGNCRLMASLAVELAETAPIWGRAVAPVAEWTAHTLWSTTKRRTNQVGSPPTRLTQNRKREAQGVAPAAQSAQVPQRENICRDCGNTIEPGSVRCFNCNRAVSSERLTEFARVGRTVVAHSADAQARRAETQRRQKTACHAWRASDQPSWLTEQVYVEQIQPALETHASNRTLASALGVSVPYAADIRRGKRRPHPRHWQALAQLAGVSASSLEIFGP